VSTVYDRLLIPLEHHKNDFMQHDENIIQGLVDSELPVSQKELVASCIYILAVGA
jgi:hypothetical protein